MAKKEVDFREFSWTWDDDNILGDFTLRCPCGKELSTDIFHIGEDKLNCKCGREFTVERTTKVVREDYKGSL